MPRREGKLLIALLLSACPSMTCAFICPLLAGVSKRLKMYESIRECVRHLNACQYMRAMMVESVVVTAAYSQRKICRGKSCIIRRNIIKSIMASERDIIDELKPKSGRSIIMLI